MKRLSAFIASLALLSPAWADEAVVRQVTPQELASYWVADRPLQPELLPQAAMGDIEACYVVEFGIDATGRARDAHVAYKEASLKRTSWPGMKPRDIARQKQATLELQEQAIVRAVESIAYSPASQNTTRSPVRSQTLPVVLSMLKLDQPDNADAVARAKAANEARRRALFDICMVKSNP